jgi:hypothetical protein
MLLICTELIGNLIYQNKHVLYSTFSLLIKVMFGLRDQHLNHANIKESFL